MITIRTIAPDDAAAFLDLCIALDRETSYMMYELGERTTAVVEQREVISAVVTSPNSTMIVADAGNRLAGYVGAHGGELEPHPPQRVHRCRRSAGIRGSRDRDPPLRRGE